MFPKTIKLQYPNGFEYPLPPNDISANRFPNVMHTRATRLVSYTEINKHKASVTLASEFDALYEILVTMDLQGDVGEVTEVAFLEMA